MRATKAAYKYSGGNIRGSLAMELDEADYWRDDIPDEEPDVLDALETEEDELCSEPAASAQIISPLSIIGFAIAAILIVFSLFTRIQLSELADQCSSLENSVSELRDEQARLLINYESSYNLTEIEQYAIGTLGMQKPNSEQIYYINTNSNDRAEILNAGSKVGFADRIGDAISSLISVFELKKD